jgi:hypothetical protein
MGNAQLSDVVSAMGYTSILPVLHWIAAVPVLAEAMNKLERTNPFESFLSRRARVIVWAKVAAWLLLGMSAACAIARPAFESWLQARGLAFGPIVILNRPSLMDVMCMAGFALLIVRSRLKEKLP